MVTGAKLEADEIQERTQQEFAWRKQQLRRETELLGRRKQAVLHQLSNLSALASETASSFPELEELKPDRDQADDDTVVRPAVSSPDSRPSSDLQATEDTTEDTAVLVAAGDEDPGRNQR